MGENEKTLVVIAVSEHKPRNENDEAKEEVVDAAPDVSSQLVVKKGDKFDLLGGDLDWWLYVKQFGGEEKGYIPSYCVVPLKDDLTDEQLSEINEGSELTASLVNDAVDLKFFPDAPVKKDTNTRKPCPEDSTNIFFRIFFFVAQQAHFHRFQEAVNRF